MLRAENDRLVADVARLCFAHLNKTREVARLSLENAILNSQSHALEGDLILAFKKKSN